MRGLLSILSLFRKEFNKFNNTGARILDLFRIFIYHMTLKLLFNRVFLHKSAKTLSYIRAVITKVNTWHYSSSAHVRY